MRVDLDHLPPHARLVDRARGTTIGLVSLGGAAIAGMGAHTMLGPAWSSAGPATFVCTAALSVVVLAIALRPTASLASAFGWSLVFGAMNAPLSFGLAIWLAGDLHAPWVTEACATAGVGLIMTMVGGGCGAAFGILYSSIVIAIRYELDRPALDLVDRVLLRLSVFLAFCCVVTLVFARGVPEQTLTGIGFALIVPLTLLAQWRMFARRRWLENVLSGEEPTLCVIPQLEAEVSPSTHRISPDDVIGHAIVRREDLPTYRTRPRALLLG